MTAMQAKPVSILHSVAEQFHRDAIDFARRFDLLWEAGPLMHKMGRTKSFVDLMMGCECALKCDGLLTGLSEPPVEVYKRVRGCNHRIGGLIDHARFASSSEPYQILRQSLSDFPVGIRYSQEAYEAFFPAFIEPEAAGLNYSKTIGNNAWVLRVRGALEQLNESVSKEFVGEITDDFDALFAHEEEMKSFAQACRKK
jgi:hypothetical protein